MPRLQMNSQHHRQLVKAKVRLLQAAAHHRAAAVAGCLQDSKLPTMRLGSGVLCSCIQMLACMCLRRTRERT
jgi:hypothetical protein